MKRLFFLLFAIWMMTTTTVAQENGSTISFTNEIGCRTKYDITVLVDIISSADTLYENVESLMKEYDEEFPSNDPNEPAILVLIPNDDYFNVIFIQEDIEGEILTLRILSEDGWLECESEAYSRELLDLASIIAFMKHFTEISDSRCCY